MNDRTKEKFQVLIADDSANDRDLLRAALERASRLHIMAEVSDGAEVVSYLAHQAGEGGASAPHLLMLDLNMPVRDGFGVLEWLREQNFTGMTVVVLTNSMKPDDIRRALDLGADFFQVKPHSHEDCVAMVLALEERLVNGVQVAWPRHSLGGVARAAHRV